LPEWKHSRGSHSTVISSVAYSLTSGFSTFATKPDYPPRDGLRIPQRIPEAWRSSGAPVDEVRRVRDDIDDRVQALLAELEGSN
jgi:hypothetical protein